MEPINNEQNDKTPAPNLKLELWEQPYSCPQCLLSPELLSINKIIGTLKIKCINHKEQEIPISKSLLELTKNNNYNAKCMLCGKKNKKEYPNEEFKYCLECNKIICKTCLDKHEKHENKNNILINLDDINNKCYLHLEPFCSFCYDCNKSICHLCISKKEHLFHKKEFLNELLTKEINEKDIESINKIFKKERDSLLKRAEELDKLIKLNELLINSYKNYPNNFNYIMNLKNLLSKNVLKDYKNDILQKKNLDRFNRVNDVYISFKIKAIDFEDQINMRPKILSKFCELQLKYLKQLNLADTNIRDLSPFKNFCFDSLEILNLKRNIINNLKPIEGLNIPNLIELYLDNNFIKNIKPLGNINYPKLRILNLSSNKISNISILSKNIFSNLKKLNLSGNKIKKINVFSEVNFKELSLLDLTDNKLTDLNSLENAPFKNLKRLYLGNTKIKSEALINLKFNELKILILSGNSLNDCSFFSKITINNLSELDLSSNEIEDISPIVNYEFNKLIKLNLNENKIKNIDCLSNAKFEELKSLYLDYNRIENIDTLSKLPFKNLKNISSKYQEIIKENKEKEENIKNEAKPIEKEEEEKVLWD